MNTMQLRIVVAGAFFLLIFLSGFWLSRAGEPHNNLLITAHKLIALGALVYLFVVFRQANRADALSAGAWILAVVTGLLFVGAIVSGGLVSIDRPWPAVVPLLHKVAPYLTALATAVTVYLVMRAT